MIKKLLAFVIIFLFIGASVVSSSGHIIENNQIHAQSQYEPHDPIYINGNDDFTSENGVRGGNGSSNDPYTIDKWKISCASQHGIIIKDTEVFFEIKNCYVFEGGASYNGIIFYNVTNGVIKNNIITGNKNGTLFATQGPNYKENSCLNKIYQNEITDNTFDGIHFQHITHGHHSENEIFQNNISGNTRGIFLIMSDSNLIYYNNIISNSEWGVFLYTCTGGGGDNMVYHNNFINNGYGMGQATCTYDYNDWDKGYPYGGNYWSDYEGEDKYSGPNQNMQGSDGIGDEPYAIYNEYGQDDYDWYPLMEPYENVTIPPYTKISLNPKYPDGENGWYISNVTVTLEADDDTGINETFYRINEVEWEKYESPFALLEDGDDILIEYYSVDIDGNIETVKSKKIDIDKTPPEMNVEWDVEKIGWRKWRVTFTITINEEISGIDRIEIFLNDLLQDTITGPGPTYSWSIVISGGVAFSFKFIGYDVAGNQATVIINDTDINSHNYNKNIFTHQSKNLGLLGFFERFPFLQRLLCLISK